MRGKGRREVGMGQREGVPVGEVAWGGGRNRDLIVISDPNTCPWATAGLTDLHLLNSRDRNKEPH